MGSMTPARLRDLRTCVQAWAAGQPVPAADLRSTVRDALRAEGYIREVSRGVWTVTPRGVAMSGLGSDFDVNYYLQAVHRVDKARERVDRRRRAWLMSVPARYVSGIGEVLELVPDRMREFADELDRLLAAVETWEGERAEAEARVRAGVQHV